MISLGQNNPARVIEKQQNAPMPQRNIPKTKLKRQSKEKNHTSDKKDS